MSSTAWSRGFVGRFYSQRLSRCLVLINYNLRYTAGHINPSDFVRLVSTAVAQTFGIYPQKVPV